MPPDVRVGKAFGISVHGIPVKKPLVRENKGFRGVQLTHYWRELTPEQRQEPCWNPENPASAALYEAAFRRLYEEEMNRWEGGGHPPKDKNAEGREAFWGVLGRTLQYVMNHIAAGGALLEWPGTPFYQAPPPPPPALAHMWAPQGLTRSTVSSSSRASSSRASSSRSSSSRSRAFGLLTPKPEFKVKPEPVTTPPRTGSSLYDELLAATQAADEDKLVEAAMAASIDDVLPMDAASSCAWSAFEHAKLAGVPFFDLTEDGGARPSRVKEEDGGAGPHRVKEEDGGAGPSRVKDEPKDPY